MERRTKVAILGSRGIPNHYGGFGQLAEHLSQGLVSHGMDVYVYNVHDHPYQESTWKGVNIIHCFDAEKKIGTAGQFIYDLNCILDSRRRKFDVIIQLGYTSSTIWCWLMPRGSKVATNMDGLEWKRSKYSKPVKQFLKFAEWLGVISSDVLIADSKGIQSYLEKKFNKPSRFIAYGADLFSADQPNYLDRYGLEPYQYNLLIARMEPENNIKEVIEGHLNSDTKTLLVVVGNTTTPYGKMLYSKYGKNEKLLFTQGIYDLNDLNHLRCFSGLYFHGHSVGGTNPSLLEAMASGAIICAHRNEFNKSILQNNAFYFENSNEISDLLNNYDRSNCLDWIPTNQKLIETEYGWEKIVSLYKTVIEELIHK